jgi:F0F1-type ATP synthase membrane subunit b/b'
MYLTALAATAGNASTTQWPQVILILGVLFVVFLLIVSVFATWQENRKTKLVASDQEAIRQLVDRYEQLAEKTMDAQQRIATELAELRTRTSAIEQILRTVE